MEELVEFKKNIIAWYPILETSKVLLVGKNDEVLEELKSKSKQVTSQEDANKIKENYDYIILIGTFENLKKDEILEKLKNIKEHLNNNGKILIAVKNRFGIKYWAGEKFEPNANSFEAIVNSKDYYLGLNNIKEILSNAGLKYKFYYPLPDYDNTNVIFTDENLPTKDGIDARDITFSKDDETLVFSEREAYKQILEQDKNMFPFFANSYFIEVSKDDNFEDIKYVSYGNTRKAQYRIKTVMKTENVYKTANNKTAESHIKDIARNINILNNAKIDCLDKFENNMIISRILKNAKTYDEFLMEEYSKNGLENVILKIKEFRANIIDKLLVEKAENKETVFEKYGINIDENLKSKMHFTKNGIIDLIFQNCLIENDKIYTYDQEWYEENVPVEFILFRAIFYFTELKKIEDVNKIYEALNIKEFIKNFENLEKKLQESIVDEKIWKLHTKSIEDFAGFSNIIENYKHQISEAEKHAKDLEDVNKEYQKQIEELDSRIKQKDVELENYANQLRAIANSISWKITKPIRSVSGMLHRKK